MTPEEQAYADYLSDQDNQRKQQEINYFLKRNNLVEVPHHNHTRSKHHAQRPKVIGKYGAPAQTEDTFRPIEQQQVSPEVMAQIVQRQQEIMAQQQQPAESPYRPTQDQRDFPSYFLSQENARRSGRGGGGIGVSSYLFSGSAIAGATKKNKSAFSELFGDRMRGW